jgi:hypothetical protein
MTVTLDLKPEVQAGLMARVQASGKTLEEYLISMLEDAVPLNATPVPAKHRAAAFEAWAASHRQTPPLSDYAVSRDGIYEELNRG